MQDFESLSMKMESTSKYAAKLKAQFIASAFA